MPDHRPSVRGLVLLTLLFLLFPGLFKPAQAQDQDPPYRSYLPAVIDAASSTGQDLAENEPYSLWLPFAPPQWMGPDGGSVVALLVDPFDSDVIYAGSWGGGVYKSTNGGLSWFWASQGMDNFHVDTLAPDPSHPGTLYAGTHGGGVFKTTDGAMTWTPARQGMQAQAAVYTVTVNPGNPDLLYAGTRTLAPPEGPPWRGVLYKSVNAGASWFPVLTNVGGTSAQDWVYSVKVNPSAPEIVLAATHEHGPYFANEYGGAGDWVPASEGAGDMAGRAVAFDPRSWTRQAFYATWHGAGVYRSNDNGQSWTSSNTGLDYAKVYPNGIVVVPQSPDTLYLATFGDTTVRGVMKSTDTGATWARAGLSQDKIYAIAVSPDNPSVLYAGTYYNGLFKSSNGGESWTKYIDGLVNTNVTQVVEGLHGILLASTKGSGVVRSTDGGRTWIGFNAGLVDLDINGLVRHPANPALIYALTNSGGLRQYLIGGEGRWSLAAGITADAPALERDLADPLLRWEPMDELSHMLTGEDIPEAADEGNVASVINGSAVNAPLLSLTFAPSESRVAYLGTNGSGIYRSFDSGSIFAPAGLSGQMVRSIAVSPTDFNVVYAATNTRGVVKVTSDGGRTWNDTLLSGVDIYSVAVSPRLADGGYTVYAGTSSGVWIYRNGTWSQSGLQGQAVTVVVVNPLNANRVLAGTKTGVYTNVGPDQRTWILVNEELANYTIQSISFSSLQPDYGYIGTTTRGLVKLKLPR